VDDPPDIEIVGSGSEEFGIILEVTQATIASVTQQRAQHLGLVRVIDAQPLDRPAPTHGTEAVLTCNHCLVVCDGDAVSAPKLIASIAGADFAGSALSQDLLAAILRFRYIGSLA